MRKKDERCRATRVSSQESEEKKYLCLSGTPSGSGSTFIATPTTDTPETSRLRSASVLRLACRPGLVAPSTQEWLGERCVTNGHRGSVGSYLFSEKPGAAE